MTRRDALRLLALGMTAGAAACKPADSIVPYVRQPEGLTPGTPLQYATTLPLGGFGRGVLVTALDGRPIKIAGNELHPASAGATDVFAEADILGLFDPERSQAPRKGALIRSWEAFETELSDRLDALRAAGGEGLTLLTGRITAPTLLRQIAALRDGPFPGLRWRRYEPINDDNARAGARRAFGRPIQAIPRLERADVVLCLSADPLGHGPDQIRNARGFSERRTVRAGRGTMQRLFVAEAAMTLTGAMADHRLTLAPNAIGDLARSLAARIENPSGNADTNGFAEAAARDLLDHRGRALVLAGEDMPASVHDLVHRMNQRLGAHGATLDLVEPVDPHPEDHGESLAGLAAELRVGKVDTLLVLGGNPVFDGPADLDLADAVRHANFSAHLGLHPNETAAACHWHLPESHPLESWGDLRAVDGTASVIQPLILPLYATRSAHDLLGLLAGEPQSARERVRDTWKARAPAADFESWWRRVLHDGAVPNSAARHAAVPLAPPAPPAAGAGPSSADLTLLFRPDPSVWDGRYADNAWLQECPKPLTGETWGNALRLSVADAARLGLKTGDALRLDLSGRSIEAPLLVDKGQAPGVAALSMGYGRMAAGAIGRGLGANAYALRTSRAPWIAPGLAVTRIGEAEALPRSQWTLEEAGQDLAPRVDLAALLDAGNRAPPERNPRTLYPDQPYQEPYLGTVETYAWAMVIDTTLCIGCNACVVACQSENNVPVVGPDEIRKGRDMHWLRIDAYDKAKAQASAPEPVFQPVPCMHCEAAPCEPVCPVGASVHDHEGLNNQVYNRCVGTRFCQANCPYKVRRFNFFGYGEGQEYANQGEPVVKARQNPDVSVRGRGVMEKCTYCVQRISGARRTAEREGRRIREGDVTTACAAACPTSAIAFGDLNADGSNVLRLKREPQHHVLLEEAGTRPRTTYLARIRNPHPDLSEAGG